MRQFLFLLLLFINKVITLLETFENHNILSLLTLALVHPWTKSVPEVQSMKSMSIYIRFKQNSVSIPPSLCEVEHHLSSLYVTVIWLTVQLNNHSILK